MARIAVLNVGSYSHAGAVTRLAAAIARAGHEVIGFGPDHFRDRIEAAGARFERHEPPLGPVNNHLELAASYAAATEAVTDELTEQLFDLDVELLVHDHMVPWGRIAGEFLGLPRITCQPGFPGPGPPVEEPADADTPLNMIETSRLSVARKWRVELGHWMDLLQSTGEGTVTLTTERIAGGRKLASHWSYVGPLLDPPPPRQPSSGRPLVYACFGTTFNWELEPFRAVVEGLAGEPVDVIVSTGAGKVSADALGTLPGNVEVRDFVDQRATLARANVHITHGGCNSTHESLLAGVPMLCMPQAADQFAMTAQVQALGAGRKVRETALAVRRGVRWLLRDEGPTKRARKLGRHLIRYDGQRRVTAVVDRVLGEAAGAP